MFGFSIAFATSSTCLIRKPEGLTLGELATETGVHRSTIFRYLRTLEARRYVEQDADTGVYRFGFAFLPLYSRQVDTLVQRMRRHLVSLRDQFNETANLGLLEGTEVIYLEIVESTRAMRLAERAGASRPDPLDSAGTGDCCIAAP